MFVGPDMTGKTHIAKEVAKRLVLPYFKPKTEHDTFLRNEDGFISQLRYADTQLIDFITQTGCSFVRDRGYPCELVYSSVFSRVTDDVILERLDDAYAALGTLIVVCTRSSYAGIVDDINEKITEPVLIKLDQKYREFSYWTRCNVMKLNVDDFDLDREAKEVISFLEQLDRAPTYAMKLNVI